LSATAHWAKAEAPGAIFAPARQVVLPSTINHQLPTILAPNLFAVKQSMHN
jgi:hypothetical protein